jgi:hypothetical protein
MTALAVTTDGRPYAAPGFDHEAHDRWVLEGNCPVASVSKAWCGKKAGHAGRHGSPLLTAPGRIRTAPAGTVGKGKPVPVSSPLDVKWVEWDR